MSLILYIYIYKYKDCTVSAFSSEERSTITKSWHVDKDTQIGTTWQHVSLDECQPFINNYKVIFLNINTL